MVAIVGDVFRVKAIGDLGKPGEMHVNVFRFQLETVVDGENAAIEADIKALMDTMYGLLLAELHEDFSVINYQIENLTQGLLLSDQTTNLTGVRTDDALPWQVCSLIVGRTAAGGRQGRKYIAGFTEISSAGGGVIQGLAITALDNFAVSYVASKVGVSGNMYDPGIGGDVAPPTTFEVFTSKRVLPAWRTQRSRTLRLGAT